MGNPKIPPVPSKALKYLTEQRGLTIDEIEKYHLGCFDGRDEKGRFTPHLKTYLKTKYPDAEPCDFVYMGLLRTPEKREYTHEELKAMRWEDLHDPFDQVSGPYVTFPSYSQRKDNGEPFVSSYVKRNISPKKKSARYTSHNWGTGPTIASDNLPLLPLGGVLPEMAEKDLDAIVITEGNIDAIIANRIPGVTAISNKTAVVSDKKVQALIDYGKPVIIAFDNDAKGRTGANRFSEKLAFADVPHVAIEYDEMDAKDLDEIYQKSPKRLQTLLNNAYQKIREKSDQTKEIQSKENYQKIIDFYQNQKEIILCLDAVQASELRGKGFKNILAVTKLKEVFRKNRYGHNIPNSQRFQLDDPKQLSLIKQLPNNIEYKILTPNTPTQRVIGAHISTFLTQGLHKKASIIPFKGNLQTERLSKEEIEDLISKSGDFNVDDWNKRRGEEHFSRNTRRVSINEEKRKPGSISTYQKRYLANYLAKYDSDNMSFEEASHFISSAPSGLLTDDRSEQKLTPKEWNSAVGYAYVMEQKDEVLAKFTSPEQTAKYIVQLAKTQPEWENSDLDYEVDKYGYVHLNDYLFKEKRPDSDPIHATTITYNPDAANGKGTCTYTIWSDSDMSQYLKTGTMYSEEEGKSPEADKGLDMLAVTRAITKKSLYESFNIMKDFIENDNGKVHVHATEQKKKKTNKQEANEQEKAEKIIAQSKINASQMPQIKHRK